jgi:hypothetical protein
MQDLDAENMIDRLNMVHLYQLPRLKFRCTRLLLKFKKYYDIMYSFIEFISRLIRTSYEIVQEALGRSIGFVMMPSLMLMKYLV